MVATPTSILIVWAYWRIAFLAVCNLVRLLQPCAENFQTLATEQFQRILNHMCRYSHTSDSISLLSIFCFNPLPIAVTKIPWCAQLKGEELYFGSWFQQFSPWLTGSKVETSEGCGGGRLPTSWKLGSRGSREEPNRKDVSSKECP